MQFKTLLLLSVAAIFSCIVHAQDKIFKRDGEIIDSKIKSVGIKYITYTRYDNQTGPEYTVIKDGVEKITYQNGSVDVFEIRGRMRRPHGRYDRTRTLGQGEPTPAELRPDSNIHYKSNILSLAPIQFSENGMGVSIGYERAIDKSGIVTFSMPVMATFNLNSNTYYDNNTQSYKNGHSDGMYYAMPGLKLYPSGCFGHVRYAVGPSFVMATGQQSGPGYNALGNTTYTTQTHSLLGVMLTNSLNINPTAHVYLGFEFGLGFTYLDRIGGLNQGTNVLYEGSFRIGYRF